MSALDETEIIFEEGGPGCLRIRSTEVGRVTGVQEKAGRQTAVEVDWGGEQNTTTRPSGELELDE